MRPQSLVHVLHVLSLPPLKCSSRQLPLARKSTTPLVEGRPLESGTPYVVEDTETEVSGTPSLPWCLALQSSITECRQ